MTDNNLWGNCIPMLIDGFVDCTGGQDGSDGNPEAVFTKEFPRAYPYFLRPSMINRRALHTCDRIRIFQTSVVRHSHLALEDSVLG